MGQVVQLKADPSSGLATNLQPGQQPTAQRNLTGKAAARLAAGGWLTDTQVRSLAQHPGKHRVGPKTMLVCDRPGRGAFEFRYTRNGRTRTMGLGGWPAVGLAELRNKADGLSRMLRDGRDPLEEKQASRQVAAAAQAASISFGKVAEQFIAAQEASWRNEKHRAQWRTTLHTYAAPVIGPLAIHAITTEHVLQILEPMWLTTPETASRVRGRIEAVLNYAKARGWRSGENPAAWRGHLALMLPARSKVRVVKHHAALDWREIPAFMAQLRRQDGISARALQFAILTSTRSRETREARWSEVDGQVWTIPPAHMKAGRPHRIPLSESALAILHTMQPFRLTRDGLIFPGMKRDTVLHDTSLTSVLRRLSRGDLTAHGFRSTFRDWAAEATAFPNHVVEQALAHSIGSAVEAAYRRGDLFAKRVDLMTAWAAYCESLPGA